MDVPEVIETLGNLPKEYPKLGYDDEFAMPDIHLDIVRKFDSMVGATIEGSEAKLGTILDHTLLYIHYNGINVASEYDDYESAIITRQTHYLKINGPFWVILKKRNC